MPLRPKEILQFIEKSGSRVWKAFPPAGLLFHRNTGRQHRHVVVDPTRTLLLIHFLQQKAIKTHLSHKTQGGI